MKRINNITIDNFSEQDLRDIFHDVFEQLGVTAGDLIPKDMVNVREKLIQLLFKEE
jgi:hypothetical protein